MLLVSKHQPLELPCLIIYPHSSSANLFMSAITPKQVIYFCGCLQLQLSHSLSLSPPTPPSLAGLMSVWLSTMSFVWLLSLFK